MSNILYKTFMKILTNCMTKIIEESNLLSNNQSGFREKRSTHQRILSLLSKIDHAKRLGKNIYIGYLDFKGAYDSVEHWILLWILKEYGFPEKFVNMLRSIFRNSSTKIVTAYGKTDKVFLYKGVKQGCPMSPLLFLIFINPLIEKLNELLKGYVDNKICSAFADDLILVTDNFDQIKKGFEIVYQFCNDTGMELNLGTEGNDNSKTAFTTNDDKNIDIYIKGEDSKPKKIPFIKPNDSYSYLGILINIDLNWELQEKSLKTNLLKYLIPLYNRCFSVKQTVEAINKIFIPALAYRLAVIPLKDKFIKQLDNIIANIINKKLGIFFKSSKNHLFQESKFGSPNVKSLINVKIERMVNTIYQIGLNGKDEELRKIIYNYQYKDNSLWFEDLKKKGFLFTKQIEINLERFRLINWLSDDVKNNIQKDYSIWNFINILGELIKYKDLRIKISEINYELIKRELVYENNEIRPLILYHIGLKEKIKQINSNEIWIDGSFENNKTSYATLFDNGKYNNDNLPALNKQSNNRGELTAFLMVLWMTREVKMIKIYTDSSYVKYIFDKVQDNKLNKENNLDIINEIKMIINDRNKKEHIVKIIHINSHLLDGNKNIKNKEKKIENMKNILGNEYNKILEGNKKLIN